MVFANEGLGGSPPGGILRRRPPDEWMLAALVLLLLLALLCGTAQGRAYRRDREQLQAALEEALESRDSAVKELAAAALASAREKQARAAQAAEYEATGAWEYIGDCRLTAYCCEPYAHICGTGDGLTATGIPVAPGIAAVDPAVIPLGSTLVIDGQRYLAADTGGSVSGRAVDIAVATHREAVEFGARRAPVWIVKEAQP